MLDPDYIILDTSGSGSAGSGTVLAGSNPGSTLDLNVNSAFANLAVSAIILQAVYDITLAGGTSWNLSETIGANFGGVTSGQLTLEAGRNIIFGDGSKITDANNWSVALEAGYNFANNTVQSGCREHLFEWRQRPVGQRINSTVARVNQLDGGKQHRGRFRLPTH